MKNIRRTIVASTFSAGLIIAGANVATASSTPRQDLPAAVVSTVAEAYVDVRNAALVETAAPGVGMASLPSAIAPELESRTTSDVAALVARRSLLAAQGERYSRAQSSSTVLSVARSGADAVARVENDTRLYYVRTAVDQPEFTEFTVTREFTFSPSPNGWTLSGVRLLRGAGPVPVNEVGSPADDAAAATTSSDSAGSSAVLGPSSSVARPAAATATPTTKSGTAGLSANASRYDYSAMVAYETRWWNSRNPAYRSWGDDCTNFLSQALSAGGWPMTSGWYRSDSVWWYNSFNQSYTWTSADHWHGFATGSGRAQVLSNVWFMGIADVLQADWSSDGRIDHSMMVTAISGGQIYLTYHTDDTLNQSLSSILAANPGTTWYAHRT